MRNFAGGKLEPRTCLVDSIGSASILGLRGDGRGSQGVFESVLRVRSDDIPVTLDRQDLQRNGVLLGVTTFLGRRALHPLSGFSQRGPRVFTMRMHQRIVDIRNGQRCQQGGQRKQVQPMAQGESALRKPNFSHS